MQEQSNRHSFMIWKKAFHSSPVKEKVAFSIPLYSQSQSLDTYRYSYLRIGNARNVCIISGQNLIIILDWREGLCIAQRTRNLRAKFSRPQTTYVWVQWQKVAIWILSYIHTRLIQDSFLYKRYLPFSWPMANSGHKCQWNLSPYSSHKQKTFKSRSQVTRLSSVKTLYRNFDCDLI